MGVYKVWGYFIGFERNIVSYVVIAENAYGAASHVCNVFAAKKKIFIPTRVQLMKGGPDSERRLHN